MVGSSLWLWTIEAPAATQARASVAISAGVRGAWGLTLFGIPPFSATSMIAPDTGRILLYPGYRVPRLGEGGFVRLGISTFPTGDSIDVRILGRALEERGFESLFVPEHTHIPALPRTVTP